MFKWREGQHGVIHQTNIKRGITSSFARTLKVLQQKHLQFNEEEFIYSNDASNNLCNSLEAAFLHGLKDSVAQKLTAYVGLTAAPDSLTVVNFWSVVVKFTHSDVVTQLQNLSQINTEIGLCRAWVRIALNDGLMESYLHSMIVDTKTLKYFYHSYAYLRDHEQPGILKNYLTGLMSLDFKLSYNSSVLNHWNNSTLQLIGALEPHSAPSPTVRQMEWGQIGVVSVQQGGPSGSTTAASSVSSPSQLPPSQAPVDCASILDKATADLQTVAVADLQTVAVADLQTAAVADLQTAAVADLQTAAAAKDDTISCLSLTSSEESYAAHISYQDPRTGVVSGLDRASRDGSVASPSPQYTADGDNSSEQFSVVRLPQPEDHNDKGLLDTSENQDLPVARTSLAHIETIQASHAVVDETALLDNATLPRPRSRRVGEEDIQHIFSSSLSPLYSRESMDSRSGYYHSDESEDIEKKAALSPLQHSNQSSDTGQKCQTPPKRNRSPHVEDQSDVFSEVQDTQLTFTTPDHHKATTSAEMFAGQEQLDQEVVLRAPKVRKSRVFDTKTIEASSLQLNDSVPPVDGTESSAVNDLPCEKQSETQQKLSVADESSPIVTADRIRQPSVPMVSESSLSALSENQENERERVITRIVQGFQQSHDSTVLQSAAMHDSMTTGHPGERTSSMAIHYNETFQRGRDVEAAETAIEISSSPSRFGNSLGSLSGWSSEIESKIERKKRSQADKNRAESFSTMLRAYAPASTEGSYTPTLNEVIKDLPCEADGDSFSGDQNSEEMSPTRNSDNSQWEEESCLENFEVLKSPSEFFCGQVEANSSRMYCLFHVPRELGLSHQNFSCKGCYRPIGIIYGQPRLCEFDGGLYCHGCHENKETYVPSLILYDWDFRKKKVCQDNFRFLQELEDQALYDVEQLNPKLYTHVPELQELKLLRQQLCYLKSYLFTCSQKVAESLRQKVWPREHLYDRRDLYSLTDFLQVQSGALQKLLKDLVKFSSQHVYDCVLCSQKGFVCEICRNPQVIYPFEVNTTVRCQMCKQVYHQSCKTESQPCPKCERWGRHVSNSSISEDHPEDYGMSPCS